MLHWAIGCATLPLNSGLLPGGGEHPAAVVLVERHFEDGDYGGDVDVVAQQVSQGGQPLWNANSPGGFTVSVPVATSEFSERHPVAVPDGRGGTFVAYEAFPNEGPMAGHSRIWAQHLDARGHPTWNEGMRSVEVGSNPAFVASNPVLVPDGRGGVVVVYEAEFVEGEHAGDRDIMAQRIARFGTPLWGEGLLVASSGMLEQSPSAVSDGRGGALIVFESEARDGEYAGDSEIMAQRVSRRGRVLFNGGARSLVVSAGRVAERSPVAVSDGRGGVIALFEQHVLDGPYLDRVWIAGQRVSRQGRLKWNGGQRSTAVSLGPFVHAELSAVSDGRGGAIAAFEGVLAETDEPENSEVFAQRIDGQGRLRYGQGGQAVLVASSRQAEVRPRLVSDGKGGAIVVFEQPQPDQGKVLAAQRLDAFGQKQWGDRGRTSVVVSDRASPDANPVVAPDGQGGVLVFFEEPLTDVAVLEHKVIKGQRVNALGERVWHGGDRATVVSGSLASEEQPVVSRP